MAWLTGRNPFLNQVIFESWRRPCGMRTSPKGGRNPFLNQVIFELALRKHFVKESKKKYVAIPS